MAKAAGELILNGATKWLAKGAAAAGAAYGLNGIYDSLNNYFSKYYNDHKTSRLTPQKTNISQPNSYYFNYMNKYGRYRGFRRRWYGRRRCRSCGNSLTYKYDIPIKIRWEQSNQSLAGDFYFNYENNAGTIIGDSTKHIAFHILANNDRWAQLQKDYNQIRIKGIKLNWHPNLTGSSTNSSFPLLAVYMEYPGKSNPEYLGSYYQVVDRENHLILGAAPASRYTKFYIKYTDTVNFRDSFTKGFICFADDKSNAKMPDNIVVGTLVLRFYFQLKGRNT